MSIDAQMIQSLCPELESAVIQAHLGRLEEAYLQRFDVEAVALHLRCLAKLSPGHPVEVFIGPDDNWISQCTVLAFDCSFLFSLISGVLSGTGFRIESGDVFTLGRTVAEKKQRSPAKLLRYRHQKTQLHDPFKNRVVIDHFSGTLGAGVDKHQWPGQVRQAMEQVIALLMKNDAAAARKAKRQVNEMVTARLTQLNTDERTLLQPVQLKVDQLHQQRSRLTIIAQDTPAFLYSLSTALSLHGLSIERLRITSMGDRVEDEVHVVDRDGKPIIDQQLLERVKFSVLLTKQFTYFLNTSPDPFTALERFERLTEDINRLPQRDEWVQLLSNRSTMTDLAKLLGTSDYLWEDFIRSKYETLLPMLRPKTPRLPGTDGRQVYDPTQTLPLRMEQCLRGAVGLAQQQDRLNKFKDQEIFRIDLKHILTPNADFRQFARNLTLLADNLIAAAALLVYHDLVKSYGTPGSPLTEAETIVHYAVFGLGKLGGVALGYASDIELLFIYTADGHTSGGKRESITNAEFYEQLARETSQFIKSKHEGIFHVDLRLRPFGNEGPLASSRKQFRVYYGPGGKAHHFEKLALVRMRWIAGHPALGFDVEQMRDAFIYDQPDWDLDALWAIWRKQHEQIVRSAPPGQSGACNAKYSCGALSDLEGAVMLLQVMHADRVPQLRSPQLSIAMEGLRRAGVLSPREYGDLMGAYEFYRRLINGLRMLRGSAKDLFLPAPESDAIIHLARRIGYDKMDDKSPGEQLFMEFQQHVAAVRQFVQRHFDRPCAGRVFHAP